MSKIEVNQISSQCGSTLTIGQSGDSIQLACGATQTGFGRTGTVDWDTTAKTASFTAVSGNGYFCNTTSSAFTVNLPAGSAGAIVSLADYAATWQTNNLTVSPNGSEKIGGVNADVVLNTEGQSVTFVYIDSTQGWINVQDSTSNVRGDSFITATGGTITTSGNFKIHTFTGPGTFCVSSLSNTPANNEISYVVVAGGGAGGTGNGPCSGTKTGGGGGAGGFRESKSGVDSYTASPLEGATPITVTATAFPIAVGAGGVFNCSFGGSGNPGSVSTFSTITSAAGAGGGGGCGSAGFAGGSGGGGNSFPFSTRPGGLGNSPPVSPPQGNPGGSGNHAAGSAKSGGGGGAGVAGNNGVGGPPTCLSDYGFGGNGVATLINPATGEPSGCTQYYAGGGGGGNNNPFPSPLIPGPEALAGGLGGGGNGGAGGLSTVNATANTGGGGGGGSESACFLDGSNGGSGIVIIRYKYQ